MFIQEAEDEVSTNYTYSSHNFLLLTRQVKEAGNEDLFI